MKSQFSEFEQRGVVIHGLEDHDTYAIPQDNVGLGNCLFLALMNFDFDEYLV